MNTSIILAAIVVTQIIGDYFIKLASGRADGILTSTFMLGVVFYSATAFGWYFLMKSHSLAAIGVLYSASTILLLTALGYFVFKENIGLKDGLGITLAILSVVVMSYRA